jgi:peptidyl-prolyl cis-trans isomerase A (cyclophilin A)
MKTVQSISVLLVASLFLLSCTKTNPQILIKTELGNITLELYPEKAPVTVANFIRYIKENRLQDATFYRTVTLDNQPDNEVKIEVVQGGLYEDEHPQMLPPIPHETTEMTGILHKDGVISMARYTPGTATSEFFICVGDQPSLDYNGNRNSDGQGFAAFGKVIEGMDVVRAIQQSPADGQWLKPRAKILGIELVE